MSFAEQIINDDFMWNSVIEALSTQRRKRSNTGFINICCPMCVDRGEKRPDRYFRCGIKNTHPGVYIQCKNCGFKTNHVVGHQMTKNMRDFLMKVGMSETDTKRLAHRAFQISRLVQSSPEAQALANIELTMQFPVVDLPKGALSFDVLANQGCTDPDFLDTANYLFARGADMANTTTFYWTPERDKNEFRDRAMNRRVIIPFYYQGKIVGWTARSIDKSSRDRYISDQPQDYLFNADIMSDRKRKYIIITEGPFDALAVDGVCSFGANLNERQCMWINSFGKEVILVPDRDSGGQRMIELAMKYKWKVAFPALSAAHATRNWWAADVKDCAEALRRYGRLYTLTSVLKTATNSAIEITMKSKLLFGTEKKKESE